MRILVYGAGNIGSLYAALLKQSGQDVSILARGKRLADISQRGIYGRTGTPGSASDKQADALEGPWLLRSE